MRRNLRPAPILAVAFVAASLAAPQVAGAAKVNFADSGPFPYSGSNVGSHVFKATGTGGPITTTCTSATYSGNATQNATSLSGVQPSFAFCTYTQGGLSGGAAFNCGTWSISVANATVNTTTGTVTDNSSSAFASFSLNSACTIKINANCTLVIAPATYRLNTSGTPGQDGVSTSADTGTFPAYSGRNSVRLQASTPASMVVKSQTSGGCAAFGFAGTTSYATGQYTGTEQLNTIWLNN